MIRLLTIIVLGFAILFGCGRDSTPEMAGGGDVPQTDSPKQSQVPIVQIPAVLQTYIPKQATQTPTAVPTQTPTPGCNGDDDSKRHKKD